MGPGRPVQALGGNFDNRSAGPVHVKTIPVSIASVTKAQGAATGTCDSGDFTVAHRTITVGAIIAKGRGTGTWRGATIKFRNKLAVDQNACMGATVKLRYTIS